MIKDKFQEEDVYNGKCIEQCNVKMYILKFLPLSHTPFTSKVVSFIAKLSPSFSVNWTEMVINLDFPHPPPGKYNKTLIQQNFDPI